MKLSSNVQIFQNKWIYRVEHEADGIQRYMTKLMIKSFSQREGINFHNIFTPVVKNDFY